MFRLLVVTLLGMLSTKVFAQNVFQDNFALNGTLVGTVPTLGGNWTQTGTTATNPLTVSAGALQIVNTGQDANAAFSTSVPATAGTRLFAGMDINVATATATGDYFFHFSDPVNSTTNFYQRVHLRSIGTGFNVGMQSNSGAGTVTTWGTTVYNFNQTYRLVTSWEFVGGTGNDIINVYINPTDAIQSNNTAEIANYFWTGTGEPAQVSGVNFRQGGATIFPTLTVDNLIVTTTFSNAFTPVPEPTTILAMSALGVSAFGFIRRRRNRSA